MRLISIMRILIISLLPELIGYVSKKLVIVLKRKNKELDDSKKDSEVTQ